MAGGGLGVKMRCGGVKEAGEENQEDKYRWRISPIPPFFSSPVYLTEMPLPRHGRRRHGVVLRQIDDGELVHQLVFDAVLSCCLLV